MFLFSSDFNNLDNRHAKKYANTHTHTNRLDISDRDEGRPLDALATGI